MATSTMAASETYKYVVLGAGNAAGYVAREFVSRAQLSKGDLCLVGEEPVLPYERPALSKAVLMKSDVRLPGFHTCVGGGGERQTADWYADKGISTALDFQATQVDIANKTVRSESGVVITATDALILATGAAPIELTKLPGSHLAGIYYLRNNTQALHLYDALQACSGRNGGSKTVLVVGGGYIGMEVAAAATLVGCKVKMIFPEANLMSRLFTPDIARHYERYYEARGVEFIKDGALCQEFLSNASSGRVGGVKYSKNGLEYDVEGDIVVVGVGARPNTHLFKGQLDLDERGGVMVDECMKTTADGVYAIGDIATFPLNDTRTRMEHVLNARQSAAHAVGAIYGSKAAYDYLPYFYSRVFDLSWKFYGDSTGQDTECIVVGDFAPKLLAAWVKDGKVCGIFMEGADDADTATMQKIARTQRRVDVVALKSVAGAENALKLIIS